MTAAPEDTGATRVGYEPSATVDDPVALLPAGTLLVGGRYRIIDKIGDGAMSTVYAAVDTMASAQVALKILTGRYRTRPDAEQRLQNEAEYAGRLPDHPNLVRPLAVGRVHELLDRPYLAMELAHGPLLAMVIIFETPMALARVCSLVGGVARALADLHRLGIVHRDIKPTNVIVVDTPGGQVAKLIDFGLATIVGEGRTSAHELTADHERPGTKRYMAPEQAAGVKPTPAFDVYALGVTLHEALTGVTPWHDHPEEEVVRRKADPDQPSFSLGSARTDVLPLLRDVVDRCLACEPEQRPTAQQVALTLDAVLAELEGRAGTTVAARMAAAPRTVDGTEVVPKGPKTEPRGIKVVGEGAVVEEIVVAASGPEAAPILPRVVSEQVMSAPTGRHPNVPLEATTRSSAVWIGVTALLLVGAGLIGWKLLRGPTEDPHRTGLGENSAPSPAAAGAPDGARGASQAASDGVSRDTSAAVPGARDDGPADAPAEAPGDTPGDARGEAPGGARGEAPGDARGEAPGDARGEAPGDAGAKSPEIASDPGQPSAPRDVTPTRPSDDKGQVPTKPRAGTRPPAPAAGTQNDSPREPTRASGTAWDTDACVQTRKQAESAMASGDYAAVLAAVADKRCWNDKVAHRRLRVAALANTRKFSQCVTVGQGSSDPEVVAYVELCRSKESSQ